MFKLLQSTVFVGALALAMTEQETISRASWKVDLSRNWDVLGPFPIQAREQQFLSPSFPLNLSEPIDYGKTWSSAYADGGSVGWSKTKSNKGQLEISFPDTRWKSLRATEGWAALQHHAVLHSSITVYPPGLITSKIPPRLLIDLVQGSYFTIIPSSIDKGTPPQWFAGNIYAMERALPRSIPLPHPPSFDTPTTYEIYVSGDYEIRLFGDPHDRDSEIPEQIISLKIELEESVVQLVREPSQDVVCDFVQGLAFGDAIGVGLRSISGWWTVTSVNVTGDVADFLALKLIRPTRLAPSQTRLIPIKLQQTQALSSSIIDLQMNITAVLDSDPNSETIIIVSLPLKHLPIWTSNEFDPIMSSYFFANTMPTLFAAIPPKYELSGDPRPVILALHGAGVDLVTSPFWTQAMPRNDHSWFVLPTGRTSWGLDWHGPSATDVWSSLDALEEILSSASAWSLWKIQKHTPAVIIGHSNGGQGTWYLASRFPDRVLGAVPAAAYIKSQAYVPLAMSRSAHFIDPILRGILESSLTPDDNDLFASNLVDTPILAIHGGEDGNVPVWHSRQAVDVVKTWSPNANVTFREDPGENHWYDSVFNNHQVRNFLDALLAGNPRPPSRSFTLTVAIPAESGSLHGWRIEALSIPGRLGRIRVEIGEGDKISVATSNVAWFSVDRRVFAVSSIRIDEEHLKISEDSKLLRFQAVEGKVWKVATPHYPGIQSSGRIQTILSSPGPLLLVVPDDNHQREMSVALRIAHDLNTYHKLDTNIITSSEALTVDDKILNQGNIVVVGNEASQAIGQRFSLDLQKSQIAPYFSKPGMGLLFLHNHPRLAGGRMLLMQSTDSDFGLERAARLFPIRSGIPVPDWIVTAPEADKIGAAGIVAAGVWGTEWSFSETMSWTW
ncbi:hypothetical protein C8J56DRAFT_954942 [Mycena floridula]|nr:hypothetical protein C8J56DRAFT_954942 [Mycena floridula]